MALTTDITVKAPLSGETGAIFIDIREESTRLAVSIEQVVSNGMLDQMVSHLAAIREEREAGEIVRAYTAYGEPLFRELFQGFLLPQVLSRYGEPSEVLLFPILYDPPSLRDSVVSLVMLYRDQHFFVEYVFPNSADGSYYVGCPSQTGDIALFTWSPAVDIGLPQIAKRLSGVGMNELSLDYYRPIGEAASLTLNDFHRLYVAEDSACLRTPAALWPY